MRDLIPVDAHQWLQALPVAANTCVCELCGERRAMAKLSEGKRCKLRYESASSGYKPAIGPGATR
jgi:hypothetical protein